MLGQGSRISAYIPRTGDRICGTLCGIYKSPRSGKRQWLMVTDQKSSHYQDYPDIGIPNSTVFVDINDGSENEIERMDELEASAWAHTCPMVGVYAAQDFTWDQVNFPAGTVGRIVRFIGDQYVEVMWNLPAVPNNSRDRKYSYLRPWQVPFKHLAFGTVHLPEARIVTTWVDGPPMSTDLKPRFKTGDTVTYMSSRSIRVAGKDDRNYAVVKGTVLSVLGVDRALVTATVIGNCQDKMIGAHLRTDTSAVVPFPFTWIPEGKKVRVTKEIMFRKRSLQDQIGVVLSSTDQDGDVGVQFSEDIGAGSLDGLGHDGRCLYIPAQALEVSG